MLISRFYKPNKKYFIVKHIAISIYYYVQILRHYTWFELLLLVFVQEQSIVCQDFRLNKQDRAINFIRFTI